MRLPGTRYQEPGWEQVRKLLGQCSLLAFARLGRAPALAEYVDAVAEALHAARQSPRARADGNSYGDSVGELALTLLYELQARPADWDAFIAAAPPDAADALLRKKFNDLYATLRDKVDADSYVAACGRPCSANRMYAYRMLDAAWHDIAALLADWQANAAQVGAILGREIVVTPIETRQVHSIAACKPEWILRWSATLARFGAGPGPLDTRSKRFDALKNNPVRIGAMLAEIGEYESLSANRDADWRLDSDEAQLWLDDYARVLGESQQAAHTGPDRLLDAGLPEPDEGCDASPVDGADDVLLAASVSLPPGFISMARAAQDAHSWAARKMADDALPVRLAVYLKLIGPHDDVYPAAWCDPATGELPTMQQLAVLAQVSLPTLRKRRDAAIARLKENMG